MDPHTSFTEKAKTAPKTIVFPESGDERIIEAAVKAHTEGIARPLLVGEREEIESACSSRGLPLDGIDCISPLDEHKRDAFARRYAHNRGINERIARKVVRKPLFFGAMLVDSGEADGMVAGATHTTRSVIEAASLCIGFTEGFSTASSFFIMIIPELEGEKEKILVFADCAVIVSPDPDTLAQIGVASAHNARTLLDTEPRVAFLSFSTKGSASHDDVDKVRAALDVARRLAPDIAMDGELQGDAALVQNIAAKKAKGSTVAGRANVLVFPDLDAGNIAYKLVQYCAHATALGPIMQGFRKPVNDLSRGASIDDILGVTAITVVQAQQSS